MKRDIKTYFDFLLYRLIMLVLDLQNNYQFKKNYGNFRFNENHRNRRIEGLRSESGIILGTIDKFIKEAEEPIHTLLLPGENNDIKEAYCRHFGIKKAKTAGLQNDMDYYWDFEQDPPSTMGKFDLIVSQAILEHLINPYKHIEDLSKLLHVKGYLIVHSVIPGYFYHRYPLDCLRFYPDWFEEVAVRLHLVIIDKHIKKGHIFYKYQKV